MDVLHLLRIACQIAIAVGIVNVWLFRANSPSPYRGGSARTMREEFEVYGLPSWSMPVVGAIKLACAAVIFLRLFLPAPADIAAGVLVVLMIGAIAMHVKIKDEWQKSMPAVVMLVLSLAVILLSSH